MEMPKPSPGHANLARMAGNWKGEDTMYPSQWDPKGSVANAMMKARVDLSGFALICDYVQEKDGAVVFTGHGVTTYDPEQDLYTLHWFDCMGSPPEVFTGNLKNDILTVAHGGPGMHARLTYDLSKPGTLRTSMEMSQDGKAWNKMFDGVYTKG